jgi:glycosyltransferase involved in cell wall biosynthesis
MNVSVIIPAYNEEKYLRKCLESLRGQIEKPDEIIVVDNNCTDRTAEIAKSSGAIVIEEKNQGMIYARNAGFNAAKYEILARTDSDTILPKDWIIKVKKAFADPDIDALSGPAAYFQTSLMSGFSAFLTIVWFYILGAMLGSPPMFGPNMAIRKSAWEKVKKDTCLKDSDVHEDIDLAIHLARIGKIKFDNNFTVITTRGRWLRIFTVYVVRLIKMLLSHRKNSHNKSQ